MARDAQYIIDKVRSLSDNNYGPDELYLSESELLVYINSNYQEVYRALFRYKLHTIETVTTVTITGATDYAIPSDILFVKAVWEILNSGRAKKLKQHTTRVRPNTAFKGPAETFRIYNSRIEFNPIPSSGTYEIRYIPTPGEITATTDELVGLDNWEDAVVWATVCDVRYKEDLDMGYCMERREWWREQMRLEAVKQNTEAVPIARNEDNFLEGNRHLLGDDWWF